MGVDVFDAVVGAVGFGPDGALLWGAFTDDFSSGVADDVFGRLVDDDDAGEIVVVQRDFFSGLDDDFHDPRAIILEDGLVPFGSGFGVMRTRGEEQAKKTCEEERLHEVEA